MVYNSQPLDLDKAFGALSDGTRRAMLERLARGEATVTELARPFDMSLPAAAKHVRVLERAGLLSRQIEGRSHRLRIRGEVFRYMGGWIDRYKPFWEGRLDALGAFLAKGREGRKRG